MNDNLNELEYLCKQLRSTKQTDKKMKSDKKLDSNYLSAQGLENLVLNLNKNLPENKNQTLGEYLSKSSDSASSIQDVIAELTEGMDEPKPAKKNNTNKSSSASIKLETKAKKIMQEVDERIDALFRQEKTQPKVYKFENLSKVNKDNEIMVYPYTKTKKSEFMFDNKKNYTNTTMKLIGDDKFAPLNLMRFTSK